MKRMLIIVATLATFGFGLLAAGALAEKPPAPPGKDPCSHGNTGKECRPDPQPDKGKDCEAHGKQGGRNEDHCKQEDTTSTSTTTTTTTDTTTTTTSTDSTTTDTSTETTTTTTNETTTTTAPETTTTSEPVPAASPPKAKPPAGGKQPKAQKPPKGPRAGAPDQPRELPHTGLGLVLSGLLGASMLASGVVLRRREA